MIRTSSRIRWAAGACLAMVATGAPVALTASPASAATNQVITPGSFVKAASDTRATGGWSFTAQGLHVFTTDSANPASSANKSAEYWNYAHKLTDVTSGSMDWTNTDASKTTKEPSVQLVLDCNGAANPGGYTVLVGEKAYANGNDWWSTRNPSTACGQAAPVTGGSSGSQWHGTLAQWGTALPDAQIQLVGFSLGSGLYGDGTISKITLNAATDPTTFTFSDTVVSPTAGVVQPAITLQANKRHVKRRHFVRLSGTATPDRAGYSVILQRKVSTGRKGHRHFKWVGIARTTVAPGSSYAFRYKAPRRTGVVRFRVVELATPTSYEAASPVVRVSVRRSHRHMCDPED